MKGRDFKYCGQWTFWPNESGHVGRRYIDVVLALIRYFWLKAVKKCVLAESFTRVEAVRVGKAFNAIT